MLPAAAATILGTVLSFALQVAKEEMVRIIKDAEVNTCFKSLLEKMDNLSIQCGDYHINSMDRSENWRDKVTKLKNLAYKIEDCVDRFKIGRTKAKAFADDIKELKSSLDEQDKDLSDYINKTGNEQASSSGSQSQDDGGIPDYARVVGMKESHFDLMALIRNSVNSVEMRPKVISIVGSGGMGKSCLAATVFDHRVVRGSFPIRAFSFAAGKNKENFLLHILQKIHDALRLGGGILNPTGQNPHGHSIGTVLNADIQELIDKVRTRLAGRTREEKRYFIVIDGVQGEELVDYVIEKLAVVDQEVVGILMVTTTIHKVAKGLGTRYGHVYKMRQLNVEESVKLFRSQHRKRHPDLTTPDEAELNSMGIGNECDGVPVAVISMARFWEGDDTRCRTAWSKFFDPVERYKLGEMRKVLDHSYNSLPSIDAETCLHYFSLFPGGSPMRRGSLLRRWMAESAAATGYSERENLKTLIDRNVICPVQASIDKDLEPKTCRPSRAMLGYISLMSKREGFVHRTVPSSEPCGPTGTVRWLSIHQKQTDASDILELATADVTHLRTLVVSSGGGENNAMPAAAALSLHKCALLRVLDLEAWQGAERINLNRIKKLKLLKYLSLAANTIGYVPQEIAQLNCLETLQVGKDKEVVVHVDVIKLPSLKHLLGKFRLRKSWELIFFPGRFEKSKLVTLAGFVTLTGNGFPQLMEKMRMLRKVKIFFDPSASKGSLSDRLANSIKSFIHNASIADTEGERRSLSIDLHECKRQESALRSLDGARGTLYSLKLRGGHNLIQIPSFIVNLKNGISKLCLSYTSISWGAILQGLSNFPELKYLKLEEKDKFDGVTVNGQPAPVLLIQAQQFNHLQRMCLQSAGNLPQIEIQGEALVNLVSLHLISGYLGVPRTVIYNDSTNQNHVDNQIPPLRSLKEVTLQSSRVCINNIKKHWYEAARDHPKKPQVLFIEDPPHA